MHEEFCTETLLTYRQACSVINNYNMQETRKPNESEKNEETAARTPLFRRYQIKIKAGVRAGAVPTGGGGFPEGF